MLMEVKFSWMNAGSDPKAVNSLTFTEMARIPAIGELVELNVMLSQTETVCKSGRVKDVIWEISHRPLTRVTVLLGA